MTERNFLIIKIIEGMATIGGYFYAIPIEEEIRLERAIKKFNITTNEMVEEDIFTEIDAEVITDGENYSSIEFLSQEITDSIIEEENPLGILTLAIEKCNIKNNQIINDSEIDNNWLITKLSEIIQSLRLRGTTSPLLMEKLQDLKNDSGIKSFLEKLIDEKLEFLGYIFTVEKREEEVVTITSNPAPSKGEEVELITGIRKELHKIIKWKLFYHPLTFNFIEIRNEYSHLNVIESTPLSGQLIGVSEAGLIEFYNYLQTLGTYGFSYISKEDLSFLTRFSNKIFVSGTKVQIGKFTPEIGNKMADINIDNLCFTFKIEGDFAKLAAFNNLTISIVENNHPGLLFSHPCPPSWRPLADSDGLGPPDEAGKNFEAKFENLKNLVIRMKRLQST